MKAVLFHGPGRLSVEDVAEPRLEEATDAIVKVSLAAICGSELPSYRGLIERTPGGIGHEFVGTVSAIGEGVKRVQVGQRAVSPGSVACGGCFYCKQGLLTGCERFQAFGRHLPGAHAEYVRVPNADAMLEALPDGLPDEKAIFAAGLLTGVYAALTSVGLKAGDSVAVVGCGPTGLSAQLMARTMGAGQVFAIDHHGYRRDAAAKLGATPIDGDGIAAKIKAATGGRGADIAIEAVGTAEALAEAAGLARRWGALLSLGTELDKKPVLFPIGNLVGEHVRLAPAGSPPVKNYMAPVIKMLTGGVIDPAPIITHTLALSEAPRGFEMIAARRDSVLKVALKP
ncbi:MAG: alcohol dehydrogenase catalytic domain-containing protein [Dehalococcoidia bacterium]|nr:alcohol dehydrogenase catalytic domain-containing protein [Dehalococcoidia bacterium]